MLNTLVDISKYNELKELEDILSNRNISTVYQPIISLIDGEIIGYEALSRGPENSSLQSPDKLFGTAQTYNKTWEVEQLCRTKAIERANNIEKDKYLFINVDPHIFKDEKFKKGFTKEFLAEHNMSPNSIIFEITEKTCIEDYRGFKQALSNYVDQGYKIAVDDMGSGYSGLKMLNETKPHYVKIDMDLIRNINEDFFKQSIIESFVKLSKTTNMKLIAEGIETEEELKTLINLGVYAGQGFFISRPCENFIDIPGFVKELVKSCNESKNNAHDCRVNNIGEIARRDNTFKPITKCSEIKEYFDSSDINGVCIVENNIPLGLIMKDTLDFMLSVKYDSVMASRYPVSAIMDNNPLIVDYFTSIREVSRMAMSRKAKNTYDYIIITKNDRYYGITSVKSLLSYSIMCECNHVEQVD